MKLFLSILNTLVNVPAGSSGWDHDRGILPREAEFPAGTISSSPWEGWWHHEPMASNI
jgi:hypothetical protein